VKSGNPLFSTAEPYSLLKGKPPSSPKAALKEIREAVTRLADGGVTSVLWKVAICGKSLYHTAVATRFDGDNGASGRALAAALAGTDVLAAACDACRHARLEILLAVRPFDDYFPSLGSRFEAAHRHMLWESRDREFALRGVLSLAYPEAAAYRLEIVEELLAYDAAGIVIDVESNAAAMTPFRRRDFFGYEAPVAEAHRKAYGEDIAAFDGVEYRRASDLQIVDAVFAGGDFNREGWHSVKGSFFADFMKKAAALAKSKGKRLGLSRGREEGVLPMARMAVPADEFLRERVIDDLLLPRGAGQDRELSVYLSARPQGGRVASGMDSDEADCRILSPAAAQNRGQNQR